MKIIKKIVLATACTGLLLTFSACGNSKKEDAIKSYKDYIQSKGIKTGWKLKEVYEQKGDINIDVNVTSAPQLRILQGLSRMDRTVVARNGCPSYKSEFWSILKGEYGKMHVWISLFAKGNASRLTKVSCPFPQKGTIIKYKNQ